MGFNGEYGRGAVVDEELRGCTAIGGLTKLKDMLPKSLIVVWIGLTGYILNQGIPSIAFHPLTITLTHITWGGMKPCTVHCLPIKEG